MVKVALEVNKPNVGLSFKKVTAPKVRGDVAYRSVKGYSYEVFLSDLYDFMVDGFEETGNYFYLGGSLVEEDAGVKEMLDYGVSQGILAVFSVGTGDYLYVEIVDVPTIKSLVEFYITEDYADQHGQEVVLLQERINGDVMELMAKYLESQSVLLNDLYNVVSNTDDVTATVSLREKVKQKIAIAGLRDTSVIVLDGEAVPVYNISLGMALKVVSIARLSVIGLTPAELKSWSVLKAGYYKLENVGITGNADALVLEGVLKNDTY